MYRVHTFPSCFVVQPLRGEDGPALRIDRDTGVMVPTAQDVDVANAASQVIHGIVGTIRLLRGRYLIVITASERVAEIDGCVVRRVADTLILPFSAGKPTAELKKRGELGDEERYLALLHATLAHYTFYFSADYDLTHTAQRIAEMRSRNSGGKHEPAWKRADERFFWNRFLVQDLIDGNLHRWVLPIMSGYVFQRETSMNGHTINFVLISRRSCLRTGRRFTRRGLDDKGHAANFAETEQLVFVRSPERDATHVMSFVQTRGSIPLIWRQDVSLKYAPSIRISSDSDATEAAFKRHFAQQTKLYGRQVLINLINHKGKELALEKAFSAMVNTAQVANVRFVSFDFHHECRKMQWHNLSKLVNEVDDEFPTMGYFSMDTSPGVFHIHSDSDDFKVLTRQTGTFRTNCMDCLDRTNVVQGLFARRVLLQHLREQGVEKKKHGDTFGSSDFEHMYKNVWANNADMMSVQYSGTGALKTDFTRTGKRTKMGLLQDGKNSLMRYYLNNFRDGDAQDGVDLMLGNYVPRKDQPSPFRQGPRQGSMMVLLGYVALALALLLIVWSYLGPMLGVYTPGRNGMRLLYWVAFPLLARKISLSMGDKYVNKPRLCPDAPVASATSSKKL
eukprot:TRINITY_DN65849_c1_g1_i1.p1 TRINITY_DN65849_c1_g1~~TRINITY_DN65849_c1_g1_i1.p1  ORF type:complete len:619 (+),score=344.64 TRINITY_DN65849_c1_g1_i1:163-2019(+)